MLSGKNCFVMSNIRITGKNRAGKWMHSVIRLLKQSSLWMSLFISFNLNVYSQQQNANPDGAAVFYYPDGKKSSEGTMLNGKPDGYWKTYYPSGTIKSEGNRKKFMLDSTWKFYNEKGNLTIEYNYSKGKKNGIKKTYDIETTSCVLEENYIDDIKQGVQNEYYASGKLKTKKIFKEGKEEGIAYEYGEDGIIITIMEYKMGFLKKQEKINRKDKNGLRQGVWKDFYHSGVVKTEGPYSDDKKNGYFKEYSIKGSLLNTTKYVMDKIQNNVAELAKVDIKNEYYPTGKVKYSGGFKGDIPQGVHREYSEDGKITSSKVYDEGQLTGEGIMDEKGIQQGLWKEYHPNGQLRAQGEYKDGKRIGEWVFYHPNGKVEQKGKYDNKGWAQSQWKWYYETGNLLREENYTNNILNGMTNEYSDSGKVITKGEYVDGQKEGSWFYEMGDYREEGIYKGDKREGEWQHYYNNGKLRFEGKYIDGNPDGRHKYYYSNGKVNLEGKYIMGMKEGNWEYTDEAGLKFLTITYENDVEIKFDGVKVKPTQEEIEGGTSVPKK